MADVNFEAQRMAELMEQVNRELAAFGRISQQTADEVYDANMQAKYGITNATKGFNTAGQAVGQLAQAGMAAGRAMLEGRKGAAAFNDALTDLSATVTLVGTALTLLIPGGVLIKGLIAGLTAVTTAGIKYAQSANEMADKLSKGYQGLAKSGAAAADGMTGVFDDAKKLGLSMNELDQMVNIVSESAVDFALFGGSVAAGRKQFANLAQALEPARAGLMNLGMDMEEINAATAGYIRLQSRQGRTQQQTVDELAASAKRYLYEQDALTKLTGATRKEQEAAREEILSNERFNAKLSEMRASGDKAQIDAANELEKTYVILRANNKDAAQAFADINAGYLTTQAAQQGYLATNGEILRQAQQIQTGQQTSIGAAQQIGQEYGRIAKDANGLAQMGLFEQIFGSFLGAQRLGIQASKDLESQYQQILANQESQRRAEKDRILGQQTELVLAQQRANREAELLVKAGIAPAQSAMISLANAAESAAKALNKIADSKPAGPGPKTAQEATAQAAQAKIKREEAEAASDKANKERERVIAEQGRASEEAKLARIRAEQARVEAQRAQAEELHRNRIKQQLNQVEQAKKQTQPPAQPAPAQPTTQPAAVQPTTQPAAVQPAPTTVKIAIESLPTVAQPGTAGPSTVPIPPGPMPQPQQSQPIAPTRVQPPVSAAIPRPESKPPSKIDSNQPQKPSTQPTLSGQAATTDAKTYSQEMAAYLKKIAVVESSGKVGAKAETSTAAGLFQFIEKTWLEATKAMGKDYSLEDRFDPKKSAEVAAYFTEQNKRYLSKSLGTDQINNTDLYMAHFLGAEGASKFLRLLKDNPDKPATEVVPARQTKANAQIFYKGFQDYQKTPLETLQPRSLKEVYELMDKKMGRAQLQVALGKTTEAVMALAAGGVIRARPGGTPAIIGEGGKDEAVIPLQDGVIPIKWPDKFSKLLDQYQSINNFAANSASMVKVISDTGRILSSDRFMTVLQSIKNSGTSLQDSSSADQPEVFQEIKNQLREQTESTKQIFEKYFGTNSDQQQIALLAEIVRTQQNSNVIQEKLLRMAQN